MMKIRYKIILYIGIALFICLAALFVVDQILGHQIFIKK